MSIDFKNVRGLLESFDLEETEVNRINDLLTPVINQLDETQKTQIMDKLNRTNDKGENSDTKSLIDFIDSEFSGELLEQLQNAITNNVDLINYLQDLILDKII